MLSAILPFPGKPLRSAAQRAAVHPQHDQQDGRRSTTTNVDIAPPLAASWERAQEKACLTGFDANE